MKKPWYKDWKFWTGLTVATLATLPYGGVGGFAFIAAYAGATAISNIYQNYKASKAEAASRPPAQQGERSDTSQEQVLETQREQALTPEQKNKRNAINALVENAKTNDAIKAFFANGVVPPEQENKLQLQENMVQDLNKTQEAKFIDEVAKLAQEQAGARRNSATEYVSYLESATGSEYATPVKEEERPYAQLKFPESPQNRASTNLTSEYAKIVSSEPPPPPATPPPSTTTATKIQSILQATEGQSAPPPPPRTAPPPPPRLRQTNPGRA